MSYSRVFHPCPLPFALCLLPALFWSLSFCSRSPFLSQETRTTDGAANPAKAVVQLLAVGPGAGDKNRECSATGFLINAAGYILTNAHVVDEARRCLERSTEGKIVAKFAGSDSQAEAVSCDLVGTDEAHDLAVLKLERPPAGEGTAKFAALEAGDVGEGTQVAVTGHSASTWRPTTERGRMIRHALLALDESRTEKAEVLILDIPLQRGASGSPVYLESGAVIGVVSRQNPSRPTETVAVPICHAIGLLNRLGVRWTSGAP
jgi:S1-C subfamily serine protease